MIAPDIPDPIGRVLARDGPNDNKNFVRGSSIGDCPPTISSSKSNLLRTSDFNPSSPVDSAA